jgi:hypothetical protein
MSFLDATMATLAPIYNKSGVLANFSPPNATAALRARPDHHHAGGPAAFLLEPMVTDAWHVSL